MNHCYFCTECYFYIEINKQLEFQISQQEVYVNQIDNSTVDCVWDVHNINPEQPVSFESKFTHVVKHGIQIEGRPYIL